MATIYCDATASDIHDEDRELIERLARVQSLQKQLLQLRSLLPERIISPIKQSVATQHGNRLVLNPAALAAQLNKVALQGSAEVGSFRTGWYSDEIRSIREQTNTTYYPQGDDAWRVDYQRLARDMAKLNPKNVEENDAVDDAALNPEMSDEDNAKVFEQFRKSYPRIKLEIEEDSAESIAKVRVASLNLKILKEKRSAVEGFVATANVDSQKPGVNRDIYRSLAQRLPEKRLADMLSLLLSYQDAINRSCDKCGLVFDDNLDMAFARKSARTDPAGQKIWAAFHPKCS